MLSGRIQKKDLWAVVCIAIVIAAYSLFWYHGGPDFGARYWFITIVPLVALSVRGLETISEKLANADGLDRRFNFPLLCGAAAISFITLLSYLPWRATDKYYHYLEMQPGIEKLAKDYHFGRSLVLVRGAEHPDYQSAWIYNPVNFGGDVPLYAWDKNIDVRSQLLKAYPDRPVWLVDGPTITGNGFQVVRGPLTAVDESEIAFDQ